MDKAINIINLLGWSCLLLRVGLQVFLNREEFLVADITFDVYLLKSVQLFQIFDIVLILLGKSKGSILGAFFQIFGRNIVSLIFISSQSHNLRFATVAIIWAMADINRYLYYIFKENPLTGFLRYNSFLVLYPIGVFGQMMIINDFIERNKDSMEEYQLYIIRAIQGCIVIGMLFLYNYMMKSRKRYLKSLEKSPEKVEEATSQTPKSPRRQSKRD